MITTPQEYINSIDGAGKEWLIEFHEYMRHTHPDITPVMFRQRPMFKVGKSYVMFTAAKNSFSMHTLNFDLIEELKKQIPGCGKGKGCVSIRYDNKAAKPVLKAMCDRIVTINSQENPPPVDVTPELPYNEQLDKIFVPGKERWRPLYLELLEQARIRLPEFREYFPAAGILWKHKSTFAGIQVTKATMRIEFYADRFQPEYSPVKYRQLSANRIMHLIELTDLANSEAILDWLMESYTLTKKKGGTSE